VVDAAIVDGTAHLSAMLAGMLAGGFAHEQRATGLLDGGAPFYDVYETADGRHMSVGALEPQFYDVLIDKLELDGAPDRNDLTQWPALREALTARFKERTQAEWAEVFDGSDACCAPVLPMTEAVDHPHLRARGTYVDRDGVLQPAPAPRFSRTVATLDTGPTVPGGQTREALTAWGVTDVDALIESGAAVQA
jgi:alpha-methylacyl-CoA racemase